MSIILGIAALILYLGAYTFIGLLLPEKWHKGKLSGMILIGFPAYYALFEIIALPLKLLDVPLKIVSLVWLAVLVLIFAAVLIFRRKQLVKCLKESVLSYKTGIFGILWVIAVSALILILVLNTDHISGYDYSYYVGVPLSSVYGNTIENIDVYTGDIPNSQREFYIMNTNTLHSAVMYQLFNVHPVIEAEISLTAVMVLLFVLYLYKAGMQLFHKDHVLAKMFSSVAVLVLLFSFGIAGSSMYFAYRAYEGKAILSFLIPAAVFCFFLMIGDPEEEGAGWAGAFLIALSGIAFSNSALFIIPGLIALLGIPYIITHHDKKTIIRAVIVLIPCVFWLLLHHFTG